MRKKKIFAVLLTIMMVGSLLTGCKKGNEEDASAETEVLTTTDEEGKPINDFIADDIKAADVLSGVMTFSTFRFEIGDKLFKFEDQGFMCRENDFDTKVEPGCTKELVIYYPLAISEETSSNEYLYLRGYNSSSEVTAMRNCLLCYCRDEKANSTLHLGVAKGITMGMTYDETLKACGTPDVQETENNCTVLKYGNDEDSLRIFINKSTNTVEEVAYEKVYVQDIDNKVLTKPDGVENNAE